jgi:hypothetical protein
MRTFPLVSCSLAMCLQILTPIGTASAQQEPNTARVLLDQCTAYLSGHAEAPARITCENTILSTLRTIEALPSIGLEFKPPFCFRGGSAPSARQAAQIFEKYVRGHPDMLSQPAELVVISAMKDAYPCTR